MKKLFFWTITVVGIVILSRIFSIFVESREALNWSQAKGQVTSSLLTISHFPEYIDISNDLIRWYGADVQYEYSVGNRTYLSHRVSVYDGGVRSPEDALKTMNKYRHHNDVIVYYNPNNPQQAVLEPGNTGNILILLMWGLLMTVIGLISLYEQSLDTKTSGIDYHLYWGNIYQKQGKFDLALKEFNNIIDVSPGLAQGYKSRGHLHCQKGNWVEAVADLTQAISIDPTDPFVHYRRAQAFLGKKQYDKAWEGMQKAREMGLNVKPEILEEIKKGLE